MSSLLLNAQRIVIKVGSSLVTNHGRGLDELIIHSWVQQIASLVKAHRDIVLVSSGAVAEGMRRLGWSERPAEVSALQAAAAVGQMGLVQIYERSFKQHSLHTAQVLLTHDDLSNRTRYLNARNTLLVLLKLGVITVVNENDTVVTEEIRFGDNDTLGALVANLIEADALIILTDQAGLYSADPRKQSDAKFISHAFAGDARLEEMAGGVGSALGRGGMLTKVLAAKRAARSGAHTIIADGREPEVISRLCSGEMIGTYLQAQMVKMSSRKQWLANQLQLRGALTLDDGAVQALVKGKSLLPVGVLDVDGHFERGEVVACRDQTGQEIARGLINYTALEVQQIKGKSSSVIQSTLGYLDAPELIHRDNLVLL